MTEREKFIFERKQYYSNTFVLFEIVKCLKNRELCFLTAKGEEKKKAVRYLLGFSLEYMQKHIDWFGFYGSLINMYHSVALLKPNVPVFSYHLEKRLSDEQYVNFNKNYLDFVENFNLFFDIDGKREPIKAYAETGVIKKLFDEYKLPYYILNSSKTGFHIHIPSQYMPNLSPKIIMSYATSIIYNLKGIYELECLDSGVIDMKRVCKVPYSYNSGDGSICLPLNDAQFTMYRPENVEMANVLRNVMIKNRGLLVRNHGLSENQLKANVLKFIEDFK